MKTHNNKPENLNEKPLNNNQWPTNLSETLSEWQKKFEFNYKQMEEIIKNCYKNLWKKVDVKIAYEIDNDRFPGTVNTYITIYEPETILGINSSSQKNLSMDDLKKVIANTLDLEGITLIDVRNNAISQTRTVGYYRDEHKEQKISWKTFTLIVQKKKY